MEEQEVKPSSLVGVTVLLRTAVESEVFYGGLWGAH